MGYTLLFWETQLPPKQSEQGECNSVSENLAMPLPTNNQQAACELDSSGEVSHLVDGVAEVVQNIHFGDPGFLPSVQLLQGLLHPQHSVVIVGLVIRRLPHVKAVIHCQQSTGVHPYKVQCCQI